MRVVQSCNILERLGKDPDAAGGSVEVSRSIPRSLGGRASYCIVILEAAYPFYGCTLSMIHIQILVVVNGTFVVSLLPTVCYIIFL